MRRIAGLVSGRSLVLRLMLVVALGAGLSAMHVLAAVVGHQHTAGIISGHRGSDAVGAQMPMNGAAASVGIPSRTHETTQMAADTTAQMAGAISAQVRTQITAQVKTQVGDHNHHAMGECVLFLSAGIALVVVLLAWIAARALRPSYRLTQLWLSKVIATTPWRGPPPWHWPRISLCVIRV